MAGMTSHQSTRMGKDEWLTPPDLIKRLGDFDLDPCSPINRPWNTAAKHYSMRDNGLLQPWAGRVWCNPPYGTQAVKWLNRLSHHNNGIALLFARTETVMFFQHVWPKAESILFIQGRLSFYHVDGTVATQNAGAPSVLVAYNEQNAEALESSGIEGHHVHLNGNIFIIGIESRTKTWRVIVGEAMEDLGGEASLSDIYNAVMRLAPAKVRSNKHYEPKIRQVLQKFFARSGRGKYKTS